MTKPKIMVVDDSTLVLDVVGEILRRGGYDVITRSVAIGTGAAILRERPILALLDVSMPLMSGTEISEAIRSSSLTRTTWIVLHSDKPEGELRALVRRCGADGYLPKSGDPRRLLSAVQSWTTRGRPPAGVGDSRARSASYMLIVGSSSTQERLERELETPFTMRFTDSGAEALRQMSSREAPAIVLVGTSVLDVPSSAVYRRAMRSDSSWRGRFVLIDESDGAVRSTRELDELPRWSVLDPIATLTATLATLRPRS